MVMRVARARMANFAENLGGKIPSTDRGPVLWRMTSGVSASQKASLESVNAAGIIKVRAERRIGEISRELERKPGGRTSEDATVDDATTVDKMDMLRSNGIDPRLANNCEAIAALPDAKFEKAVNATAGPGFRWRRGFPRRFCRLRQAAPGDEKIPAPVRYCMLARAWGDSGGGGMPLATCWWHTTYVVPHPGSIERCTAGCTTTHATTQ